MSLLLDETSLQVDMSLLLDTLSWFRANQSVLFLLNAACLAKKQQIPIFTWLGLEPTIYCTRGEHATQYTTDAVTIILNKRLWQNVDRNQNVDWQVFNEVTSV